MGGGSWRPRDQWNPPTPPTRDVPPKNQNKQHFVNDWRSARMKAGENPSVFRWSSSYDGTPPNRHTAMAGMCHTVGPLPKVNFHLCVGAGGGGGGQQEPP